MTPNCIRDVSDTTLNSKQLENQWFSRFFMKIARRVQIYLSNGKIKMMRKKELHDGKDYNKRINNQPVPTDLSPNKANGPN